MNIDKEEILLHLEKVHTTKLGEKRIKNNLQINEDVVDYLKKMLKKDDTAIYKKGKNYYIETCNIRITINSYNYCIITAHYIDN